MAYVLMLTCLWSVVGALVLSEGAGEPQMAYVLMLTCLWSVVGALVLSEGSGEPRMAYVLMLACLWSVVGALVFFVRANLSLTQRLALTIGTSVAFGVIGWVDMSTIYHSVNSGPTTIAKESSQAADRPSHGANSLSPSR